MPATSRDIERMVRQMKRQRLDPAYVRHYLQESYQLADPQIDELFVICEFGQKAAAGVAAPSKQAQSAAKRADKFFK